jgi:diguanylate cyclase (GGDEF)-like protein
VSTAVAVVVAALLAAVVAGGGVYLLARARLTRAQRARLDAERSRDQLRRELDHLDRTFAGVPVGPAGRAPGVTRDDELAADAFDEVSGLLLERFVAVLIQQRVAGARRRLHPVAVVALEADGERGKDRPSVDAAMRALGGVIRETLREADCACRVGDVVVIAALDDTTEEGARLAIERVQAGLRVATGDVGITVSAGIACYPTHALEAPDLVARAGEALLEARGAGISRVATASTEIRPG